MTHSGELLGVVALLVAGLLYWVYERGAASERDKKKRDEEKERQKKKEDRWGGWHL